MFSLSKPFHILVVDDNSPDGTSSIVQGLIEDQYKGRLHILNRKEKNGLGPAYIAGFKWALDKSYEFIFEMDADFSHPPEKLVDLLSNV